MALPLRHLQRVITEPGQFDDAVSGIELAVDFQRRQERASQVEQFQSPAWALDFGEANVRTRVRGVMQGGWGSFCLALGPGEAIWNGQPAVPGTLTLLPPGDELDGRTAANFTWLTVAIPPKSGTAAWPSPAWRMPVRTGSPSAISPRPSWRTSSAASLNAGQRSKAQPAHGSWTKSRKP